jgi:hypothetical protein
MLRSESSQFGQFHVTLLFVIRVGLFSQNFHRFKHNSTILVSEVILCATMRTNGITIRVTHVALEAYCLRHGTPPCVQNNCTVVAERFKQIREEPSCNPWEAENNRQD